VQQSTRHDAPKQTNDGMPFYRYDGWKDR